MSDFEDTINAVGNPQQALEQLVGEQFIEWLMAYIPQQMKTWPVLAELESSTIPLQKIKKFMLQRFLAQEAFLGAREGDPGFLRFAIANLSESDDPTAESALEMLEQKRQEELEGHRIERGILYTPQRERWTRLLRALGATDEEIDRAEPKEVTRNYIADLSDLLSNSEWQTALGALASWEKTNASEYQSLSAMLKKNTLVTDKDLEALTPNALTVHILDKVVFDLETKKLVWDGIERELAAKQDFLSGLAKYLK